MDINQAIFMTNVFAQAHPEKHVELWNEFEHAVPIVKRSGYFGADNVAYINYLRECKEPVFLNFFKDSVEGRSV